MSAEFESLFVALRDDADTLPAAPPAAVRHRADRRRRRNTVLATATVFAAVAAVVLALGFGLPRGGPPADPATPPPTPAESDPPPKFQPLTPVPTHISYGTAAPPMSGTATTIGDRAFLCWQGEGGRTTVAAIDLPTGATAWGPIELATSADYGAVYYHPGYVLVMSRDDNGMNPAAPNRAALGPVPLATDQFVQVTADGTAVLRDLATGVEKARRPGADKPGTEGIISAAAVDGTFYAIDHTTLDRIRATSLTDTTGTTDTYRTKVGSGLSGLVACGPALVCFIEGNGDERRLIGLDPRRRQVVWQLDGTVSAVQTVGDRVLARLPVSVVEEHSAIVDASGRELLPAPAQAGKVMWVTGQSALLFTADPHNTPKPGGGQDPDLFGLNPLDGDPVPLGTVGTVTGCATSRTHLACIGTTGVKVWRFAT